GDGGEAGRAAEAAHGMAQVAGGVVKPHPAPGLAAALAQPQVVAELAGGNAIGGLAGEVILQFLGQIALASGPEQVLEPAEGFQHGMRLQVTVHNALFTGLPRTPRMAATIFSKLEISSPNCLRPALVSA